MAAGSNLWLTYASENFLFFKSYLVLKGAGARALALLVSSEHPMLDGLIQQILDLHISTSKPEEDSTDEDES